MGEVKAKDPKQYHLAALKLARSRNPEQFYQLSALKHLYDARMDLLVAGNYKASQLVQNLIDVLRPYGAISEEDE